MNLRRITSLTAFLSFFIVLLTSIILYVVPQGRIAYWADWRLWALSKEQWGAIHINVGILFLLSLFLHLYYNWKPIVSYLKNKARQVKIFTGEFNIALVVTFLFIAGTLFEIPPFSTVLDIGDGIKAAAVEKYGEPPYGHAELSSLKSFSQKMNFDMDAGIRNLEKAGFRVGEAAQTLKEIALQNGVSPQEIYLAMAPQEAKKPVSDRQITPLPEMPPPGTGNLSLTELCSRYGLDLLDTAAALTAAGLELQPEMTIKKIGELNAKSPVDVYDLVRSSAPDQE